MFSGADTFSGETTNTTVLRLFCCKIRLQIFLAVASRRQSIESPRRIASDRMASRVDRATAGTFEPESTKNKSNSNSLL